MLVLHLFILMFTNSLNTQNPKLLSEKNKSQILRNGLGGKHIHSIFINRITIITLVISILLAFNPLYFQSIGKGISIYNSLFQVTILTQAIDIFLLLIGLSIISGWPLSSFVIPFSHATEKGVKSDQYSLIALFSILGGSLLMSSLDLLSMYLSIELQSFALYILATLNKDKLSATSAGLKYFLLGGLSSCFILLGSGIIYSYTGLTHFESINALISIPTLMSSSMLQAPSLELGSDINKAFQIGIIFILVGFLFKVSAAPFYQWAPDVYDGTPTIVTVWLTIIAKLTIFIFIQGFIDFPLPNTVSLFILPNHLETGLGILGNSGPILKNLLLISCLLSLIIGTVLGLSQIKIKRLLAYSSVSHVGFLLLALGIYSQKSIDSFVFYLIQYSVTSLNIFLILLAFGYLFNRYDEIKENIKYNILYYFKKEEGINNKEKKSSFPMPLSINEIRNEGLNHFNLDLEYLSELKGLINQNSLLCFSLAICLFSMAGIPPLAGFFSKQLILFSSIENGNYFLSVVAILVSVISASYYLKIINLIFFSPAPVSSLNKEKSNKEQSSNNNTLLDWGKKEIIPLSLNIKDNLAEKEIKNSIRAPYGLELSDIHSILISLFTLLILFFMFYSSLILNGTLLISLTFFQI